MLPGISGRLVTGKVPQTVLVEQLNGRQIGWLVKGWTFQMASSLFQALTGHTTIKLFFVRDVGLAVVPPLRPVPGTMRLHQVIATAPGTITYRDVSCFCKHPGQCECFSTKTFTFPAPPVVLPEPAASAVTPAALPGLDMLPHDLVEGPAPATVPADHDVVPATPAISTEHPQLVPTESLEGDLLGKWCVVRYEARAYPGIIEEVEESDVYVNCMAQIGENRLFWPRVHDRCWYKADDVMFLIPKPEKVGSRHLQVEPELWPIIERHLSSYKRGFSVTLPTLEFVFALF